MDNQIVISTPPHVKSKRTTKKIMLDVLISLLPCTIAGIVFFWYNALILIFTSVLGAVATEFVYFFIANGGFGAKCKNAGKVCKRWAKQFDFTSIITGLILALIIPATAQWYEVLIGSIFSIAIVKMLFGGTGKNLVNPAATGRVFMALSFAASINTVAGCVFDPISLDSQLYTGATNLAYLTDGNAAGKMELIDLFIGTGVAGCIGETCKIAIIVGYIYLVIRKVIKWWQPILYIGLSSFLSVCLAATSGSFNVALFPSYMLSGGLMFGAVFMATDYVTSPKGVYGQLTYYVALAVLTSLLRHFCKCEVVSYVILLMNLIVPLIDIYIVRRPFGYKRAPKQPKEPKNQKEAK